MHQKRHIVLPQPRSLRRDPLQNRIPNKASPSASFTALPGKSIGCSSSFS